MANFPITLSRRGYAYQDKYALLLLLKFLLNENLEAFHVDYPFGKKGYSLDILVIPKSPEIDLVHEVKTGESFRKSWEEIGHAFEVFFDYQKENSKRKCCFHLIISPGLQAKLDRIWSHLRFIYEKGGKGSFSFGKKKVTGKMLAEDYRKKLKLQKLFPNSKKFIEFIKSLKEFDVGNSYVRDGRSPESSSLEDEILQKIGRVMSILGATNPELELPSRYLLAILLEDIRRGVEEERDIYPLARESIIGFCARKCVIDETPGRGRSNVLLPDKEKEISGKFTEKFEGGIAKKDIRAPEVSEGKAVSNE